MKSPLFDDAGIRRPTDPSNPFMTDYSPRWGWSGAVDARTRIEMTRTFTRQQCEAALAIQGLQATVRQAVERRLRQSEKLETARGALKGEGDSQ